MSPITPPRARRPRSCGRRHPPAARRAPLRRAHVLAGLAAASSKTVVGATAATPPARAARKAARHGHRDDEQPRRPQWARELASRSSTGADVNVVWSTGEVDRQRRMAGILLSFAPEPARSGARERSRDLLVLQHLATSRSVAGTRLHRHVGNLLVQGLALGEKLGDPPAAIGSLQQWRARSFCVRRRISSTEARR